METGGNVTANAEPMGTGGNDTWNYNMWDTDAGHRPWTQTMDTTMTMWDQDAWRIDDYFGNSMDQYMQWMQMAFPMAFPWTNKGKGSKGKGKSNGRTGQGGKDNNTENGDGMFFSKGEWENFVKGKGKGEQKGKGCKSQEAPPGLSGGNADEGEDSEEEGSEVIGTAGEGFEQKTRHKATQTCGHFFWQFRHFRSQVGVSYTSASADSGTQTWWD